MAETPAAPPPRISRVRWGAVALILIVGVALFLALVSSAGPLLPLGGEDTLR